MNPNGNIKAMISDHLKRPNSSLVAYNLEIIGIFGMRRYACSDK